MRLFESPTVVRLLHGLHRAVEQTDLVTLSSVKFSMLCTEVKICKNPALDLRNEVCLNFSKAFLTGVSNEFVMV